jgi:hypothetical protein
MVLATTADIWVEVGCAACGLLLLAAAVAFAWLVFERCIGDSVGYDRAMRDVERFIELAERSRTETHGASLLLLFDPESAVAASAASSRALDLKERARRTLCEAPVEPRRRALVVGRVAASLDATGGSNR